MHITIPTITAMPIMAAMDSIKVMDFMIYLLNHITCVASSLGVLNTSSSLYILSFDQYPSPSSSIASSELDSHRSIGIKSPYFGILFKYFRIFFNV